MVAIFLAPQISQAQGVGDSLYGFNSVLDRLFQEMLPLCSRLIDVGRVIAGFAALWYIAIRVWKNIAKAEPVDFFSLLRPFAIGLAIILFPHLINLINGVLEPVVVATRAMSQDSKKAISYHIEQQEKAILERNVPLSPTGSGNTEQYQQPNGGDDGSLSNAFLIFNIKSYFKELASDFIGILYSAAALCVNTIRTFYLIILAILGPLVLGLSVFDGFQDTLSSWFSRYINVYMWLPVANIFAAITSKILENMFTLDGDFAGSVAYIIFMIISIVGYTTIPNVANYIIRAGGSDTLLDKVNGITKVAAKAAVGLYK